MKKIELKVKNGRLTKAQIKKLLLHKATEVTEDFNLTDDYQLDLQREAQNNKVDKIQLLNDIYAFDVFTSSIRGNEVKIYSSYDCYTVINPQFKF